MRSGAWFWGAVLIVVGVLLLLANLGLVRLGFDVIGSLVLVALGVWFLLGALVGPSGSETTNLSVRLGGATSARIRIKHGAGRLRMRSGAQQTDLLTGEFGGGVERQERRNGDHLDVELRLPPQAWLGFVPFSGKGRGALDWNLVLNGGLPLELSLDTGAGVTDLDLSDLQVVELSVQTGASSTEVILPARVAQHRASFTSGVAATTVRIPVGVAARIHTSGGLSDEHVDTKRFPKVGNRYESPDCDHAEFRADIHIETGVGSIEVR